MNRDEMNKIYRGPSKDAPYQVSFHLAKGFQRRRFFKNQPIRNKNGLSRPCLLTDRDEISNLYREPSIDASYQVWQGELKIPTHSIVRHTHIDHNTTEVHLAL